MPQYNKKAYGKINMVQGGFRGGSKYARVSSRTVNSFASRRK